MKKRVVVNLCGWLIAMLGTLVYLLTLEPTVSFWDCGEFIATSYKLQIGHPPGAPLYQLLAHCFMLLAGGDVTHVAWWSNALSAVAGGVTAMFLFWTLMSLLQRLQSAEDGRTPVSVWIGALTGTACYLFCDTAWFSAVESEVYSLSMMFSAMIVWSAVRWTESDATNSFRWIMLIALLLGLSIGVHLLSLLTVPALIVVVLMKRHGQWHGSLAVYVRKLALCVIFFLVGLSPYLIIPIRANANPPINQGDPSSYASFRQYVTREQYEHAPLLYGRCFNTPIMGYNDGKPVYAKEMEMFFPRMWKQHPHAEQYYTDWTGRHGKMVNVGGKEYYKPSFGDNLVVFGGYQLGYMYLRYLMWNFSGRYSDQQGFGNLQKGQFITGIPFVDRLYVGTSRRLPPSMDNTGHNRYYLLPLIIGIVGLFSQTRRDKKGFWAILTLFLTSGVLLSVYLNHPMYEPRERDYAYVLSFYTFAIWIGVGACSLTSKQWKNKRLQRYLRPLFGALAIAAPLLMACQNWDDHDRSGRYVARDTASNMLESCDNDAILFTYGDNDTFPLWYLQQVEDVRTDVQVVNISLLASDSYCRSCIRQAAMCGYGFMTDDSWGSKGPVGRMLSVIANNYGQRQICFSRYAYDSQKERFGDMMMLRGMVYRLADSVSADSVDVERSYELFTHRLSWHSIEGIYVDETSLSFLQRHWHNVLTVVDNLNKRGEHHKAQLLLDKTREELPLPQMHNALLEYQAAKAYLDANDTARGRMLLADVNRHVDEQLDYYYSMSPVMRSFIPYSIEPLVRLREMLVDESALLR